MSVPSVPQVWQPARPLESVEREETNLLETAWLTARRHALVIVGCGLAALLASVLILRRMTPIYEATAAIRVDPRQSDLPAIDALKASANNNLSTEMQMLRTRGLAAPVADSLGLRLRVTAPERRRRSEIFSLVRVAPDAALGRRLLMRTGDTSFEIRDLATDSVLARDLRAGATATVQGTTFTLAPTAVKNDRVEYSVISSDAAAAGMSSAVSVGRRARDADIMDVKYEGTDPELVRDVTNALVTRFISERQASRQSSSLGTAAFISAQLERVSAQLTASEQRLRRFRESERVVSGPDQASTDVRRAADLAAQRDALVAERVAMDRLIQSRTRAADATTLSDGAPSFRELAAFPSLLRNQAVASLLNSLTQLEDRRSELLSRRKPEDSDVRVLTDRAAEIEQELRTIARGYREGLNNQAAAIDAVLEQSNAEMDKIPAKEMRFAQLSREVKGLEQIYQQLQLRLKEVQIASASQDASVRLLDAAMLPTRAARPNRSLILLFGTLAGVALGILIVVGRELADVSVRTRADAQGALGIPVLGMVPRLVAPRAPPRLARLRATVSSGRHTDAIEARSASSIAERAGVATDAYERVHSNLLFADGNESHRVIVFTSALPRDGKTTTAVNFGMTLARRGLKAIVVDGDLRRGRVHNLFRGARTPGLSEVLSGTSSLAGCIRTVEVEGGNRLDYLACGEHPRSPTELLDSDRLSTLLRELAQRYDRVILDSPPLNVVTDAVLLGSRAQSVVIVARSGVTPTEALVYAGEQARAANLPLMGTVLNDIDFERDVYYDSSYRWYRYGAEYYAAGAPNR